MFIFSKTSLLNEVIFRIFRDTH